ncbi:MAG: DsbA family protein [Moraxella sp.]|nr:DsbA family protein [Moraxella sp.]
MNTPTITLTYLFDPLCGWCYGASPAIGELAVCDQIDLRILPTGLFSSIDKQHERTMTAEFAEYAWSNDKRIEQLTGQVFSDKYYHDVLQSFGTPFNSFVMAQALAALPTAQRPAVLELIQNARYIDGRNTTDVAVLAAVLREWGYTEVAKAMDTQANRQAAISLIQQGQQLAQNLGIQGVPALLLHGVNHQPKVLPNDWLFADVDKLTDKIITAHAQSFNV